MSDVSHAEAQHDSPPSMVVTVVGGLIMLTIFVTIGLLFIGRGAYSFQGVDGEREVERYKLLEDTKAEVAKALSAPAWVNKDKGIVTLPLDKAVERTEAALKAKTPKPGSPIQAAPPAAAPAAAATSAPAAAPK